MPEALTTLTRLLIVQEIEEDARGAVLRFQGGGHGRLDLQDPNYATYLRLARRSQERQHPVGVSFSDGQTITELIRADNDMPTQLLEDGADRARVFFEGHDGVFLVKRDYPESNRIRAVLGDAIPQKARVWFIAQKPGLVLLDVLPATSHPPKGEEKLALPDETALQAGPRMNVFPPARKGSRTLLASFAIDDFGVSWAGPGPNPGVFCLGSQNGEMQYTDADGTPLQSRPDKILSNEAINGVAFIRPWMAVTTRNELDIFTLPKKRGKRPLIAKMPFGAHGVISSPGGYFFAPLGLDGLMFTQPKDGPAQSVTVSTSPAERLYFYRVVALQTSTGREIVACATRSSGVAAMDFKGEGHQHSLSALTFDGLDVVDVCPVDVGSDSPAAAAVGRDGTIIFFRDIVHDRTPATLRYPAVQGVAYRLLSARGHIFLLTSKGLYAIAGLIDLFRTGVVANHVTPILEVPMDAVDANLVGDQWLLIVLTEGVGRFDIDLLTDLAPGNISQATMRDERPAPMTPRWKHKEVEQLLSPAEV